MNLSKKLPLAVRISDVCVYVHTHTFIYIYMYTALVLVGPWLIVWEIAGCTLYISDRQPSTHTHARARAYTQSAHPPTRAPQVHNPQTSVVVYVYSACNDERALNLPLADDWRALLFFFLARKLFVPFSPSAPAATEKPHGLITGLPSVSCCAPFPCCPVSYSR